MKSIKKQNSKFIQDYQSKTMLCISKYMLSSIIESWVFGVKNKLFMLEKCLLLGEKFWSILENNKL